MNFIKNIFRRKVMKDPVRTLRIDGVKAPVMTSKPDDAELAAQALLEHKSQPKKKTETKSEQPKEGTPEFYQQMSGKIKEAHEQETRDALRYLAYTEQELKENPTVEQLIEIERGLYQYQNAAEREHGTLKVRWQKCLAQVIVLQTKDIPDTVGDIA